MRPPDELERRVRLLRARSALLRAGLSEDARQVGGSLGAIDRGVAAARRFGIRPALIAGVTLLLFLAGPRRVSGFISGAVTGIALARRAALLLRR